MTGLIGTAAVAVIFNFGQYSIGTHLIESLAPMLGFEFPRQVNWILFMAVTSFLTLSYGRGKRGIAIVENFMKLAIGIMLVCFGICLALVGVDWGALVHGTFVPWLPSGVEGVDLFVASSAAAIGVMDWVLFQYAGLARGWGRKHETLARVDIVFGLFLPFVLINFIVMAVFRRHPSQGWDHTGDRAGTGRVPGAAPRPHLVGCPLLHRLPGRTHIHDGGHGHRRGHRHPRSPGLDTGHTVMAVEDLRPPPPNRLPGRVVPRPVWLVIAIAAFLSLATNIVGWSFYLLLNDRRLLGEDRSKSYLWNLGIMLQITLLNCVAIVYVLNRIGWWIR